MTRLNVFAAVRTWLSSLTLQRRVAALTALAVALAVAAAGVAGYYTLRSSLYQVLDSELINTANSLAAPVADEIRNSRSGQPSLAGLSQSSLQAVNVTVVVLRADGTDFTVPDAPVELTLLKEELAVARLQSEIETRSGVDAGGAEYRIVTVPIRELGNYALAVGRPLKPTNDILSSLWRAIIVFGLSGVILSAFAGALVARSSLRPVRELSAAAERVARTDELSRIEVSGGSDELTTLADAFNQMIVSLASSRERQRQLIADAGHELRTPLTSLRTNIELLGADHAAGRLRDGDRAEILADVSAQLAEFTTLIQDLVQLARDDRAQPSPEPVDVRDVVNAALDRVRRRGHGIEFRVDLNPLYVIGDSDSLERAVTNLLDNAVKWSPPGGVIRVRLSGDKLRISDEGPGIAEKDLPHVFDRFFRSDASRNTAGTGLGLSIVAQTVDRHGGWVRAGRARGGGAEFTMCLPGSTTWEELTLVGDELAAKRASH